MSGYFGSFSNKNKVHPKAEAEAPEPKDRVSRKIEYDDNWNQVSGANLAPAGAEEEATRRYSITYGPYVFSGERRSSATIQPDVDGRWMTQFGSKTFVDATWLKAAISVQAIARGLIVRAQAKHKDTNRFSSSLVSALPINVNVG